MKPQRLFGLVLIKPSRISPCLAAPSRVWRGLALLTLALCLSLAFLSPAAAADGALDTSFDPGAGVKKIPLYPGKIDYTDGSGKSLIYGYFTAVNGSTASPLPEFLATAAVNTSFNAPLNSGEIRQVVLFTPPAPTARSSSAGVSASARAATPITIWPA